MKRHLLWVSLVSVGTCAVAAAQQPGADISPLRRSLPRVSELPSGYRPIGELGDRGVFYGSGTPLFRIDDGNAHHGLAGPTAWAAMAGKGMRTQGALYGVENDVITSAGYLIRQADLVASKSFHGLTLRELPFPAAHYLTIEFRKGKTADSNQYLLLWHFLPDPGRTRPMLSTGELSPLASLPRPFTVVPIAAYPNDFYPRMGRHRRDFSTSTTRLHDATGDDSVWYGEAAGKLIFIEYIFRQQDFAAGASWGRMPLNTVPIPPIDNVHILHYNGATAEAPGTFTLHMYFIPEETYLAWETEPPSLSTALTAER